MGKAFQSSGTITSAGGGGISQAIDPDRVGQAALGSGVASAAQQLAQYYLKAADKLYPVIETDGGRTVEILITKGAVYNGKSLGEDAYRGLLKRTGTTSRRYEGD
ncbi:TrbI/VirB10 family protein [Herbaspirillum aquaticum]|uniref:TrbI/VirB10 family protein n=1 Tax=Herbaspirillum aquaticum TaxID=568783 RepID=UPI0032C4690F